MSSSSSSSENDDNRQSNYDPDMDTREMLLESALGHVVMLDRFWPAECPELATHSNCSCKLVMSAQESPGHTECLM